MDKENKIILNIDTYAFLDGKKIILRNNKGYFEIELTEARKVFAYLERRKISLIDINMCQNTLYGKQLLAVISLMINRKFARFKKVKEDSMKFEIEKNTELYHIWIKREEEKKDIYEHIWLCLVNSKVYAISKKDQSYIIVPVKNPKEFFELNRYKVKIEAENIIDIPQTIFKTVAWASNNSEFFENKFLKISDNLIEVSSVSKPYIEDSRSILNYFENNEKWYSRRILDRSNLCQIGLSKWNIFINEIKLTICGETHLQAQKNAVITFFEEKYSYLLKDNEEIVCTLIDEEKNNVTIDISIYGVLKKIYKTLPLDLTFKESKISFIKNPRVKYYENILINHSINIRYASLILNSGVVLAQIKWNKNYQVGIGLSFESAIICAYNSLFMSCLNRKISKVPFYSWMIQECKNENITKYFNNKIYEECIEKNNLYVITKVGRIY